jgi:hypothetical protein
LFWRATRAPQNAFQVRFSLGKAGVLMSLPHNLEDSKLVPFLNDLPPNQTFQKLGLCDSLQQSNNSLEKLKSIEITLAHNPTVTETFAKRQTPGLGGFLPTGATRDKYSQSLLVMQRCNFWLRWPPG